MRHGPTAAIMMYFNLQSWQPRLLRNSPICISFASAFKFCYRSGRSPRGERQIEKPARFAANAQNRLIIGFMSGYMTDSPLYEWSSYSATFNLNPTCVTR